MSLSEFDGAALAAKETAAEAQYRELCERNLILEMTRGKQAPDQFDLSNGLLAAVTPDDHLGKDDEDYRNYGTGTGIPEAKRLFADFLDVAPDVIVIGGNSSLNQMYDFVAGAVLHGVPGLDRPWGQETPPKLIGPVPGYDRHFPVCEKLGYEIVTVDMQDNGPDMDAVEALVAHDPAMKAIWCVAKYSNLVGAVYADAVIDRLATMTTAAPDFRIIRDNAYAEHHLNAGPAKIKNILEACRAAGHSDRPVLFGSTPKIFYAGAGVAVLGGYFVSVAVLDGCATEIVHIAGEVGV
ncbi:MAG: aminotransferase class I/II-fold pyridoxal phosphate-dependent enzyme, partial [Pseudomonadota bacterium]|nr:aminotransferase class I/II-fold pyridoxal phosphate-dependent enzyme [Pseudomonadota bacterium]